MFIKSIHNFRTSIKLEKPDTRNNRFIDEHFIGTYNSEDVKGFFGMYHGIKDRPDKYLRSTALNVAADEQAIYEFMQNAVDCRSTHFFTFYNESFFLSINNGYPFSEKDVKAILNLGQSDKGNAEIGSYGVGFKLAHRLIGKDDGIDELINDYKGPIVFSWSRFRELDEFLQNKISITHYSREKPEYYNRAAWLFKICLTNFPAHPREIIKDLNYEDKILFSEEELIEVINFVKDNLDNHAENLNEKVLQQGSLFFLRLGEGKKKYIDNNYSEIARGIEYSLNTLSTLQKVYINDQFIEKQKLTIFEYIIPKGSEEFHGISPKNKDRDIKIKFGYDFRYWENNHWLDAPNFYDYFPMESERHNFRFMLHCNAFDKMVNRRELQKGEINTKLFNSILPRIKADIEKLKNDPDNKKFLSVYAALLLSEHSKAQWIEKELFKPLCGILLENIPTHEGYSQSPDNVKVKNTFIQIDPSDIGCPEISWFYWHDDNKTLVDQAIAKDKLGLKKWDILDLLSYAIDHGKVDEINNWIRITNEAHLNDPEKKNWTYINFLKEVDENLTDANFKKISQIKLFKFSDGEYHSFNEVFENSDLFLISEKTSSIKSELKHLGLTTSLMDVSKNPNMNRIISSKLSELKLFQLIAEKSKTNKLKPEAKKNLFQGLVKFESVDIKHFGGLELFWDTQKRIQPLNKLIKADLEVPNWLFQFKINKFDYFPELDKYLIKIDEIYSRLIFEEWDNIVSDPLFNPHPIKLFYSSVVTYYEDEKSSSLLDDKKCIYADGIFHHHDNIFFNKGFIGLLDYNSLKEAILKCTGYLAPAKDVLEFLPKKPFIISSDHLKDHFQAANLSVHETLALFEYAEKEGIDLFSYGYFTYGDGDLLSFVTDKKVKQFHSESRAVKDFISENLSSKFTLLPKELSNYKTKVLRNVDLQEAIIDELGRSKSEHINILLDILSGSSLKRLYKEVEKFDIHYKGKYTKSDLEFKLLSNLPEDLIEGFNSKLFLINEDRKFRAIDIANANTFKINGIKLTLSKILTDNQLSENARIVSEIISSLNEIGIPKAKLDNIFNIDRAIDNDWLQDKLEILLNEEGNILENSEQLAFVLLYHKSINPVDLKKIKIHRIDGEDDTLNYTWYSQKLSYITDNAILGEQYFNINKTFELKSSNPYYNVDNESRILFEPYFDVEKEEFICDFLKESLSDAENVELFNFIFNYWSSSQANKRLIQSIDWTKINQVGIEKVIGFVTYKTIWDANIALESEKCPGWIKLWGKGAEKQAFLSDLGINMNKSPISLLRKSFISLESFPIKNITNIGQRSSILLNNTFNWLVENEIFLSLDSQYELLVALADSTEEELVKSYDFDLLENCVEWNADYYKEWKEETDCEISVFLHDGELPVRVTYDEFLLRNISEGNYAFNEDENKLYINGAIPNIETILAQVVEDKTVPFEQAHFTKLLLAKNQSNSLVTSDEVERLKKENIKLRKTLDEIASNQNVDEKGYLRKGGLSIDEQKAISLEARKLVKQKLLQYPEFDVSDWDPDEDQAIIINKVRKNGELIDIVVVSAKSSPIHLSPYAFNVLASNPNNQLFVRDRFDIHNVTFEDIFSDNQSVNLVFDTNFVPSTVLSKLSEVFNYVTNTKFVIENPHFSANSMFEGFGLENRNAGNVNIPESNEDW